MSQKMTKSQTRNENSAGGVVFYLDNGGIPSYLLIKDRYLKWTLPKGHLEEGETSTIAAVREIFEETGITVSEMIGEIGSIDFNFEKTAGDEVSKKVDFFLFKINIADTLDVFPSPDEVVEIGWFSIDEALRKADYENIKGLLESADKMIGKKQWN